MCPTQEALGAAAEARMWCARCSDLQVCGCAFWGLVVHICAMINGQAESCVLLEQVILKELSQAKRAGQARVPVRAKAKNQIEASPAVAQKGEGSAAVMCASDNDADSGSPCIAKDLGNDEQVSAERRSLGGEGGDAENSDDEDWDSDLTRDFESLTYVSCDERENDGEKDGSGEERRGGGM